MKHTISPHAEELLTSKALKSAWFLLENTQITYKLGNIPGWQVAVLIKKNAENQTIPWVNDEIENTFFSSKDSEESILKWIGWYKSDLSPDSH